MNMHLIFGKCTEDVPNSRSELYQKFLLTVLQQDETVKYPVTSFSKVIIHQSQGQPRRLEAGLDGKDS